VLIALTIVAVGTSLPELATSLIAARRGQAELALGNLIGSNIYNLGFVLGLSAVIEPVTLPRGGLADLGVMLGFAVLLLPLAVSARRVSRAEGTALLLLYVGYVAYLVTAATMQRAAG